MCSWLYIHIFIHIYTWLNYFPLYIYIYCRLYFKKTGTYIRDKRCIHPSIYLTVLQFQFHSPIQTPTKAYVLISTQPSINHTFSSVSSVLEFLGEMGDILATPQKEVIIIQPKFSLGIAQRSVSALSNLFIQVRIHAFHSMVLCF